MQTTKRRLKGYPVILAVQGSSGFPFWQVLWPFQHQAECKNSCVSALSTSTMKLKRREVGPKHFQTFLLSKFPHNPASCFGRMWHSMKFGVPQGLQPVENDTYAFFMHLACICRNLERDRHSKWPGSEFTPHLSITKFIQFYLKSVWQPFLCLCVRLPACQPACLPACLPSYLPACLPGRGG